MLGVVNTMTTLIPLHDIPSYSRSSKNGGSRTIEAANQELSLTLEDVEDMVVIALHDRIHQQGASLGKTTEEDKSLRRRECSKVGTSLTKNFTGEVENLLSQLVTLASGNSHIKRSDIFGIELTQQRFIIACLQELACRTSDTRGRAVSLQTAATTTTARTTVEAYNGMTELTGKAITAINQLTIDYDTRANASTEGNNDKVLHTASHTVSHLADGSRIGIIGKGYRDTQSIREELGQWHDARATPLQVRRKLDSTIIIVTIRSTYTHSLDLADTTHLIYNDLESLNSSLDIVVDIIISLRLDSCGHLDITTAVDNSKY